MIHYHQISKQNVTKPSIVDGDGKGKCEWLLFVFVLFLANYGVHRFYFSTIFVMYVFFI